VSYQSTMLAAGVVTFATLVGCDGSPSDSSTDPEYVSAIEYPLIDSPTPSRWDTRKQTEGLYFEYRLEGGYLGLRFQSVVVSEDPHVSVRPVTALENPPFDSWASSCVATPEKARKIEILLDASDVCTWKSTFDGRGADHMVVIMNCSYSGKAHHVLITLSSQLESELAGHEVKNPTPDSESDEIARRIISLAREVERLCSEGQN
jgi:hypothetical protein